MRSTFLLALVTALGAPFVAACGGGEAPPTGSTTTTSASGGSGGGGGAPAGPREPDAMYLPKATGPCPDFAAQGKATVTPDGKARDVEIYIGEEAKTMDGPLVFFWHGAGGDPKEATYALGPALEAIKAMGGVVIAPYHDPASSTLPWFLALGGAQEDDLRVADEALACAIEKVGVDLRRIHSVGFSAGAMHTTQFATRRSGYLASVVVYSGAHIGSPTEQDPSNKYAAMLFHGGASDNVIISFADAQQKYHDELVAAGHFAFLCNHNKGHTVPTDGRASAWQFLQDHPFGVDPEPYAGGLPAGFPSYCSL